jgi:ABC-type glycerol-3-phosphate transport system permease component
MKGGTAMAKERASRGRRGIRMHGIDGLPAQLVVHAVLAVTLLCVMAPVVITILNSLKTNYEMAAGVWTLPRTPMGSNWAIAMGGITHNMVNSVLVSLAAGAGVVFLGSLSAYVFVQHRFPGREALYYAVIALMIVPGVLSLTPQYLLVLRMGIKNTWWALVLPYVAGGQIGAIFLFRTFLSQQPPELFEAARIDGAGDMVMYTRISLPLAVPVLALQAVGCFSAYYNDFLWPTLVIDQEKRQTLMPILRALASQYTSLSGNQGVSYAIFLLSGVPLVVMAALGLKHFVNGDMAAGLKM